MIKRYHITLGASTTAGGTVTSASANRFLGDAGIALERDAVSCPACQSEGYIKLDGPRLDESVDGRQVALNNDLCICKCNPPPRLVNNQTWHAQWIDADWFASQAGAAAGAAEKLNTVDTTGVRPDSMPLLLRDPDTQAPLQQRRYRLQLGDKVLEGTTDQDGLTSPLSAAERASLLAWQVDAAKGPG